MVFHRICSTFFSFNSLCSNKNFLVCSTNTDSNRTHWIDLENDHNSSLSLKPLNLELRNLSDQGPRIQNLVNQFNNDTHENRNESEKVCSSKYYDNEEIHNIEIP